MVEYDSTQLLGAQQVVGAVVLPRGRGVQHGVQHAARRNGLVGVAIGVAAERHIKVGGAQTPAIGQSAWLAVNDREVALVRTAAAGLKSRLTEVIARVPRSEVAGAQVDRGVLRTNLTISFNNGGRWEFEVPPMVSGPVKRVAAALSY